MSGLLLEGLSVGELMSRAWGKVREAGIFPSSANGTVSVSSLGIALKE